MTLGEQCARKRASICSEGRGWRSWIKPGPGLLPYRGSHLKTLKVTFCKTRVIGQGLDCSNPNLQEVSYFTHRDSVSYRCHAVQRLLRASVAAFSAWGPTNEVGKGDELDAYVMLGRITMTYHGITFLCWLLVASVGPNRPVRRPHRSSCSLPILQRKSTISSMRQRNFIKGNVYSAWDFHPVQTIDTSLPSVTAPPLCCLDQTGYHFAAARDPDRPYQE